MKGRPTDARTLSATTKNGANTLKQSSVFWTPERVLDSHGRGQPREKRPPPRTRTPDSFKDWRAMSTLYPVCSGAELNPDPDICGIGVMNPSMLSREWD